MSGLANRTKSIIKGIARRVPLVHVAVERTNFFLKSTRSPAVQFRKAIAHQYLQGKGIEIGALHVPLALPKNATARYVDIMSASDAKRTFPELKAHRLKQVDIIDDGQFLHTIPENSLDFIVANHMLEHTPNPLGTLEIWLGKLKPNGVLFFALPNKEHSFDIERPVTTLDHLLRDYTEGPEWSNRGHFEEYARLAEHIPEDKVTQVVDKWIAEKHSIHYHVWTPDAFWEVLKHCQTELEWPIRVELEARNYGEFVNVIRKMDSHPLMNESM